MIHTLDILGMSRWLLSFWFTNTRHFKCSLMPDFKYKYRALLLLFHFHCPYCTCLIFLKSSSFLPSSFKLFKLQAHILFPMAPLPYLRVEKVVSRVTPTSLREAFPRSFLSAKTYYVQTPNSNGRIALFSFPPPLDLMDAQSKRRLVFYLKQIDYGLSFPFSSFVHSILGFF